MAILVIGFGNPSRRDDGVGLAVVNGLRSRLGLPALDEGGDGFEELGQSFDTLFLQQLAPELAETMAGYARLFLVDAHAGNYPELVHRERVQAGPGTCLVSHHMKPGMLLALTAQLYGSAPEAELISVRGLDFDFGSELSLETAAGVNQVIDEIWLYYRSQQNSD